MNVKRKRRFAVLAATAMTMLLTVACGSDDDSSPAEGATDETSPSDDGTSSDVDATVRLGSLQIANAAPQVIDPSIFEEGGITLDVQYAGSGAAIVPGVVGGSYDVGYGSVVSVLQAIDEGVPVRIVANGDVSAGELVVLADSGIEEAADLEGRTIATNAVESTVDLETAVSVEARGGDPSTLQFVEVPFPGQLAALDSGNIDAAVLPEPFLSQAKADPSYQSLFSIFDVEPSDLTNCYFASESYLEENPEVAEQFALAIGESNELAARDEAAAREAVSTVTGAPPEAVSGIQLPTWLGGPLDEEGISVAVERMVDHGFISEAPAIDDIVWRAPR